MKLNKVGYTLRVPSDSFHKVIYSFVESTIELECVAVSCPKMTKPWYNFTLKKWVIFLTDFMSKVDPSRFFTFDLNEGSLKHWFSTSAHEA